MGFTNQVVSGMVLNSQPQRVPVPYTKIILTLVEFLRGFVSEASSTSWQGALSRGDRKITTRSSGSQNDAGRFGGQTVNRLVVP
jgi:hypothetical protein